MYNIKPDERKIFFEIMETREDSPEKLVEKLIAIKINLIKEYGVNMPQIDLASFKAAREITKNK